MSWGYWENYYLRYYICTTDTLFLMSPLSGFIIALGLLLFLLLRDTLPIFEISLSSQVTGNSFVKNEVNYVLDSFIIKIYVFILKWGLLIGVDYKCNFFKKLRTKFFWVPFHLSWHETTIFSVIDATEKSGSHICDFAHFSN